MEAVALRKSHFAAMRPNRIHREARLRPERPGLANESKSPLYTRALIM
jgi:hypothetical protein